MDSILAPNSHIKGIIIEGVECSGKTTLINEIRSNLVPFDCIMLGHQDGEQFDRYMREYMFNSGVIFNRSHYSEAVYSQLWKRPNPFTSQEKDVLDSYLSKNYITLFCTADKSILAERYLKRKFKQKADVNELDFIRTLFDNLLRSRADYIYESNGEDALHDAVEYIRSRLSASGLLKNKVISDTKTVSLVSGEGH
ncbi:hypothetical protein PCO85_05475 [Prodigiosinella aquatilis]|nr:hypothetical protein [Prodigiosinella sp. LS101]WJV54880.1 hypothetical protein PCO85_05475 [Prodigiosinella sp. LS101]WJV59243.1 hypothetical protein PCO84_05485 [Pectobacteriaceae bacterium C111]